MNIVYIGWFYAESFIRSTRENEALNNELSGFYVMREKQEGYTKKIEAKLGNKIVMVMPSEVVCFEREENIGYVWMMDGRKYNIDCKMQELAEMLDPKVFYQISRSVMFSMAAIKGYDKVKNKQGLLILKDGFITEAPMLVSRHRFDGFRKVFEKYQLE